MRKGERTMSGGQSLTFESSSDTLQDVSDTVIAMSQECCLVNELLGNEDDPRVLLFLNAYAAMYKEFVDSHNSTCTLQERVRSLKGKASASEAKALAVDAIYNKSDDHVISLRREMNIVYNALIEKQESYDRNRKEVQDLDAAVTTLNENVRAADLGFPPEKLKQKELCTAKFEETKGHLDRTTADVDKLKDQFWEMGAAMTHLEDHNRHIADKTAEVQRDSLRALSEISKQRASRAKATASLTAATDLLAARKRDIVDIRRKMDLEDELCSRNADKTRGMHVQMTKIDTDLQWVNKMIRQRQFQFEKQSETNKKLQEERDHVDQQYEKMKHLTSALKEGSLKVDSVKGRIKRKEREVSSKKMKILDKKEKGKHQNAALHQELTNQRTSFEANIKRQTKSQKERDLYRKRMLQAKSTMLRERMLLTLHNMASKRLTEDNAMFVAQGKDQMEIMDRLEVEKKGYMANTAKTVRKVITVVEQTKRSTEKMLGVMLKLSDEEMRVLEIQNLYGNTCSEHAIYTRHILTLKSFLDTLSNKSRSLTYEASKLAMERDSRDESILAETLAFNAQNRQIFILRMNLGELRDSNVRTKVVIENQDIEEKQLIKITRVMGRETTRESRGLELVVRDVEALSQALMQRQRELHDLYETVKLNQSLLEKKENTYDKTWADHASLKRRLKKERTLRKLDTKRRKEQLRLTDLVQFLKNEVESVQLRSKGLMEQLSHPRNIHRWRNLLSRDPEAYESIANMRKLRRQIQEKAELCAETTIKIHLMDREFIAYTTLVLAQPSPETVLQLKIFKEDLDTRHRQLKTLKVELTMVTADERDGQIGHEEIERKKKKLEHQWYQRMCRELKRSRLERQSLVGAMALLTGTGDQSNVQLVAPSPLRPRHESPLYERSIGSSADLPPSA